MGMGLGTAIGLGLTAASTGYTVYHGEQVKRMQEKANKSAERRAKSQQEQAEQAFNAANRKKPNARNLLARQQAAGMSGGGSTILTSPQGLTSRRGGSLLGNL